MTIQLLRRMSFTLVCALAALLAWIAFRTQFNAFCFGCTAGLSVGHAVIAYVNLEFERP